MKIRLINDDEEIIEMKLFRYELSNIEKADNRRGVFYIQSKYILYVDINEKIKTFIKSSYELFVTILFDDCEDGRIKKIYSPSVFLKDDKIIIEKLNEYNF